ncbi:MAG: tRNA (adenosine(37)-N6)-threonylcarbamoyltransferase complex dimerization subunit type 1 TsaB [Hymenobacteraceae bacterium]|nr:tRNA (adenosine(37)-N6)-threonylcarbamoyltransferase complex dimerization subunit type 1 TsaB [Hymenobacteraceae bacterium]MDX5396103.1 tRNA (adenosine(37)-N6)-threonylcarbamoyltransferase complex dimerization subunit type 1 TsaB [Hymenobacteraceae bacterium]MDX5443075.1 tRNA (adenosine(37)-N6)-threonylcarbamoyltransferase complex dimerization subunit type 1 TsaB [Hymenobacteraceae bacterium]MDX5512168.1 tRNA (adenosine(37)-N6)-threonylcarbamoyltransferase complex dimerization subunit type 1 
MAVILALETSSTVCAIALSKDGALLGTSELQIEKSHSSHITVMIGQLLNNCGLTEKDLSAVAVSGGPGSYTGLRIGSATAKGLCFALDIPLIEVSTLHALAKNVIKFTPEPERYLFCPMLDARRMEVYTSLLNDELQEVLPVEPVVLQENSFHAYLDQHQIIFFGSGAAKFKQLLGPHQNALFLEDVKLSAKPVLELAEPKYEEKMFEDVAYYEPYYLKEVHITSKKKA